MTDEDAVIPAAVMPTEGQVTVSAHAVNVGPEGNIAAGDIYRKCCRDDVFATNGAFSGGQNARTYQVVTQQDINGVASSLKTNLDQSAQAAFGQPVYSNESLVTPAPCTSTVTTDHRAGDEARQVSVTVSETCTGEVYDTNALHDLLTQIITQEATKRLGGGYNLVGDLQTSITQATVNHQGTTTLHVKAISIWVYQFSQGEQEQIKAKIAGKSKAQATAALLQVPGVQTVSIMLKNGNTVPTDGRNIHLVFLQTA